MMPRSPTYHVVVTEDLWFAVLGPVRGWRGGAELELGSPQQRAVLAFLLLREGRPATAEEIIESLWGEDAPPSVNGILRTYVYRLRRLFAAGPHADPLIQSVGGSYLFPATEESVDLRLFQRNITQARTARDEDDHARAASLLEGALELWQGTPLSGIRGPYVERQRQRLEQLHDEATEDFLAARLEMGAYQEVISELVNAVAERPLHERLRELLMLALYRAGRQAEALDVYTDTYRLLDSELGVTPGSALRELHTRILQGDPALERPDSSHIVRPASPPNAAATTAVPAPVPAQIPPDIPDFTGRAAEITEITDILSAANGPVPAIGLTGLGGMGKTTLAVHVARLLRENFPDGQVYADLGAGRNDPADPAEVLAGFLRACGVLDVPSSLNERAAQWRTLLATRKMLVVLDDAANGEQVRHLLPATTGSASIVTSWRRIVGLPGLHWIKVGAMAPEDSVRLLARIAGEDRVAAEQDAAHGLVAACSHQPLAVRLAAARLLDRPTWSVTQIAWQLDEDLCEPIVMHADCAAVDEPLERAQRRLDGDAATAFRLLAVPDNRYLTAESAAAALGLTESSALAVLERLVDAYLLALDTGAFGQYYYDGLIKAYARRQAHFTDGPERCRGVVMRLADYYAAVSRAAVQASAVEGGPLQDAVWQTVPDSQDVLAVLAQVHGLPATNTPLPRQPAGTPTSDRWLAHHSGLPSDA
jgi:DNA-binding SARP family transcriptional activator